MHNNWKEKVILFLTGQSISLFGSSLVQFAIIWYITLETKSGIMLTVATLCSSIPQIIVSLFAGVWADRYNRKMLIMVSDGIIAISTLVIAIIFIMGYKDFYLLMLISAIRSTCGGIQQPAIGAVLPQIVPEDQLMRVNGINQTLQSIIFLASPAVAGVLYTFADLSYIFFIDVATAVIGVGILATIRIPLHAKAEQKQTTSHLEDFKEGLSYIKNNKFIKYLMIFYAVLMFLLVPFIFLTPLFVARKFGDEVWRLTANEIGFFVGSTLGGLVVSIWGGFKNRAYTLLISSIGFGLLGGIIAFAPNFYLYLFIMTLTGLLMPFFNTSSTVMLQERVDGNMLGRVFSFMSIVMSSSMPIGMLVFGPLADMIKIDYILIGSGVIVTGLGLWIAASKILTSFDPVVASTSEAEIES